MKLPSPLPIFIESHWQGRKNDKKKKEKKKKKKNKEKQREKEKKEPYGQQV